MTSAALSVYMYGLYLLGVALPFMLFPEFTLAVIGAGTDDDMWVRYVGALSGVIGAFYIAAVLKRINPFFAWTVPARYFTASFMAVMVATGKIGLSLLIFAALEALTASLTWVAIAADAEAGTQA